MRSQWMRKRLTAAMLAAFLGLTLAIGGVVAATRISAQQPTTNAGPQRAPETDADTETDDDQGQPDAETDDDQGQSDVEIDDDQGQPDAEIDDDQGQPPASGSPAETDDDQGQPDGSPAPGTTK